MSMSSEDGQLNELRIPFAGGDSPHALLAAQSAFLGHEARPAGDESGPWSRQSPPDRPRDPKMRIELPREHADHPLLRRVSAAQLVVHLPMKLDIIWHNN